MSPSAASAESTKQEGTPLAVRAEVDERNNSSSLFVNAIEQEGYIL
ncbi:hypothetical protein THAOC_20669, partial [Thalassiosira oceanica]